MYTKSDPALLAKRQSARSLEFYHHMEDHMKRMFFILVVLSLLTLIGCMTKPKPFDIEIIEVTLEVTRIIEVTPTPRYTSTAPIPTITPTYSCLDSAITQLDINICTNLLAEEIEKTMEKLVDTILKHYSDSPQDAKEFLRIQTEWKNLADDECSLRYGRIITDTVSGDMHYENGSMAPMMVSECRTKKYEIRIKELQSFFVY